MIGGVEGMETSGGWSQGQKDTQRWTISRYHLDVLAYNCCVGLHLQDYGISGDDQVGKKLVKMSK